VSDGARSKGKSAFVQSALAVLIHPTCDASAGYGRNREKPILEPEACKAGVVPALKHSDTNGRQHAENPGCTKMEGSARNMAEWVFTNIGGDIYPSSGSANGKFVYSLGRICPL
jgi:hypothetical protein